MAVSPSYLDYVVEQIRMIRPVTATRMFGGVGLYVDGWFVGIIDDDVLYFKVDRHSVKDYLAQRMEPFRPRGEGTTPMKYYELPAHVLEDRWELEIWLARALQAARHPAARTAQPINPKGRPGLRRGLGSGILLAATLASTGAAQSGTDIFLVPLTRSGDALGVGTPRNVTARVGYDNQPSFTPDGRAMLYSSQRSDGQNDIMRFSLIEGTTSQITKTPENEYSPLVTPDRRGITVIWDTTQYLRRYQLDGGNPGIVFNRIKPVGYHTWLSEDTALLFVLGQPATLQLATTTTGAAITVAWNIGRSLHKVPGKNAGAFIQRMPDGAAYIMEIDGITRALRPLVRAVEGAQDFTIMPDGSILMGRRGAIYQWIPGGSGAWKMVAQFRQPELQSITRLAVSPQGDLLAVVSDEVPPGT